MTKLVNKKPSLFDAAWGHFQVIYGDGTLPHVGETIGGKVKLNIDAGFFTNACAIRISYTLNKSGLLIPRSRKWKTSSGAGRPKPWYIYRVKDLVKFLNFKLGVASKVVYEPLPSDFKDQKGILLFDVKDWTDATGHATLWDGEKCSDKGYFNEANKASLWVLPS